MASVTYLKSIANNTPYTLTLVNGEDPSHSLAVAAQGVWMGALAIPWVGRASENYKALKLILGPRADAVIWVFQDYWEPAHQNAIKHLEAAQMAYASAEVEEVPGSNRGAGYKNLIVSLVGREFRLLLA